MVASTLFELRQHLRYLLEFGGHGVLPDDAYPIIHLIAFINSLTDEERREPDLVLRSPARWRRAQIGAGAGAQFPEPQVLEDLLSLLTSIKNRHR